MRRFCSCPNKRLSLLFKRFIYMFILLFVCMTGQAMSVQVHWQQDDYLIESFIEIALKREYQHNKKTMTLQRWRQPLKIFIKSENGDSALQQKLYRIQAKHLQSITHHPISFVGSEQQANVIIVFTSYKNMRSRALHYKFNTENLDQVLKDAVCMASIKSNQQSEIIQGVILIPVDSARQKGRLVDCIIEELTQVMGLPNDSVNVYPSIFNDRSIDSYLSGLDYLLLKMAYHPLLKPGMNESQVRQKLPTILLQLRAQGEIDNAQWRVLDNSLKEWLGR